MAVVIMVAGGFFMTAGQVHHERRIGSDSQYARQANQNQKLIE